MRFYLVSTVVGAFLGGALATFFAPVVLETLLASTGAQDAMCQCTELVKNTANLLIRTQLVGAGIGAVIALLGSALLRRRFGKGKAVAEVPGEG